MILGNMKTSKQLGGWVGLGLFFMAGWAGGFPNPEMNPFSADQRPESIQIQEIQGTIERDSEGVVERLVFQGTADGHEVRMWMTRDESELLVDGISILPDKSGGCGGSPFYSLYAGDLNQDGIQDYLLDLWHGGCGWAAGGETLTFILSSGQTFKTTCIAANYPGPENFVMLDGKPCFIHTSTGEVGEPERKCVEYYYVHNILVIDGTSLRLDNSLFSGFPVLQNDHMNCDTMEDVERVQSIVGKMTPEQKDELIQKAIDGIFQ